MEAKRPMDKKALQKALIVLAVGIVLAIIPTPAGLQPNAWYYFALFAAAILALILEPIPTAAVGLVAVTLATVLCLVTPGKPKDSIAWMLAGFATTCSPKATRRAAWDGASPFSW
jgi:L-tartrate/succinate antiporter